MAADSVVAIGHTAIHLEYVDGTLRRSREVGSRRRSAMVTSTGVVCRPFITMVSRPLHSSKSIAANGLTGEEAMLERAAVYVDPAELGRSSASSGRELVGPRSAPKNLKCASSP